MLIDDHSPEESIHGSLKGGGHTDHTQLIHCKESEDSVLIKARCETPGNFLGTLSRGPTGFVTTASQQMISCNVSVLLRLASSLLCLPLFTLSLELPLPILLDAVTFSLLLPLTSNNILSRKLEMLMFVSVPLRTQGRNQIDSVSLPLIRIYTQTGIAHELSESDEIVSDCRLVTDSTNHVLPWPPLIVLPLIFGVVQTRPKLISCPTLVAPFLEEGASTVGQRPPYGSWNLGSNFQVPSSPPTSMSTRGSHVAAQAASTKQADSPTRLSSSCSVCLLPPKSHSLKFRTATR